MAGALSRFSACATYEKGGRSLFKEPATHRSATAYSDLAKGFCPFGVFLTYKSTQASAANILYPEDPVCGDSQASSEKTEEVHHAKRKESKAIKSTSTALFVVLQQYPPGTVLCAVMALLIFTFLVTASNSATYVLGMYSEGGTLHPSNRSKIIWGALIAALAAIMMLGTSNGLSMLQTLSIVAAFPFIFIMLAAMPALVKALKEEKL